MAEYFEFYLPECDQICLVENTGVSLSSSCQFR